MIGSKQIAPGYIVSSIYSTPKTSCTNDWWHFCFKQQPTNSVKCYPLPLWHHSFSISCHVQALYVRLVQNIATDPHKCIRELTSSSYWLQSTPVSDLYCSSTSLRIYRDDTDVSTFNDGFHKGGQRMCSSDDTLTSSIFLGSSINGGSYCETHLHWDWQ